MAPRAKSEPSGELSKVLTQFHGLGAKAERRSPRSCASLTRWWGGRRMCIRRHTSMPNYAVEGTCQISPPPDAILPLRGTGQSSTTECPGNAQEHLRESLLKVHRRRRCWAGAHMSAVRMTPPSVPDSMGPSGSGNTQPGVVAESIPEALRFGQGRDHASPAGRKFLIQSEPGRTRPGGLGTSCGTSFGSAAANGADGIETRPHLGFVNPSQSLLWRPPLSAGRLLRTAPANSPARQRRLGRDVGNI